MTKSQKRLCLPPEKLASKILCQQAALELPTVNKNTKIYNPINYLPQTTNQAERTEPKEKILQAVLISDEPEKVKTKTAIERLLNPLGIAATLLFVSANLLLAQTISKNQAIVEIRPAAEASATEPIPNLAARELVKLDLQTIISLKPQSKSQTPEPKHQTSEIKVKVLPGAYSDLATALLPPSLRPYLYKSHLVEPIPASELPAEVKLQKLR